MKLTVPCAIMRQLARVMAAPRMLLVSHVCRCSSRPIETSLSDWLTDRPLQITYINSVVMPDEESEGSEEGSEEEDDGSEEDENS